MSFSLACPWKRSWKSQLCALLASLELEVAMWPSSGEWNISQGPPAAPLPSSFCHERRREAGGCAITMAVLSHKWVLQLDLDPELLMEETAIACPQLWFKFKLKFFCCLTRWLPMTDELNIWVAILWLFENKWSNQNWTYTTPLIWGNYFFS